MTKTIEKGKKGNTLSEEMYKNFERFYENHTVAKLNAAKEQNTYENAKAILAGGGNVDDVAMWLKIPRDELLSMKAELEKETAE